MAAELELATKEVIEAKTPGTDNGDEDDSGAQGHHQLPTALHNKYAVGGMDKIKCPDHVDGKENSGQGRQQAKNECGTGDEFHTGDNGGTDLGLRDAKTGELGGGIRKALAEEFLPAVSDKHHTEDGSGKQQCTISQRVVGHS